MPDAECGHDVDGEGEAALRAKEILGRPAWFFLGLGTAAAAVGGIIALAVGYVTLRLRDDYLAIPSLGIAETVRLFFLNEKWVANGSKGLYRIPEFLGEWVSPKYYDYLNVVVVLVVLAVLFLVVERSVKSPWGRVLRAVREDEVAAEASSKSVFRFKLQAFAGVKASNKLGVLQFCLSPDSGG